MNAADADWENVHGNELNHAADCECERCRDTDLYDETWWEDDA